MPSLEDFKVDERKVWFGKYWPEGVPKQIAEVSNVKITPLFEGFQRCATEGNFWDSDVCLAVFGTYIERVTFRTLLKHGKRFGTYLYSLGFRKGDVLAIQLPNSINFVVAYLGLMYIGGIVTGVNPTYKPAEIEHALKLTGAKGFVVMDALYNHGPKDIIANTDVKFVFSTNLLDFVTADEPIFGALRKAIPDFMDVFPTETEHYKVINFKEAILKTTPEKITVDIDPWTHPAAYIMTGGTTGLPKVAMISHANFLATLYGQKDWINIEVGTVHIGIIPFYHVFGLSSIINGSIFLGAPMLLFPKPPDAKTLCEVIKQIEAPKGILYSGVEILFQHLISLVEEMGEEEFLKKYDFPQKLKYASQGAGPLHDYIRIPFEKTFCPIRTGYGLTETSPVITSTPFWGPNKTGKVGLPIPGTDMAIFDSKDFEKGPICDGTPELGNFGVEHTGEICIAGAQVMLDYKGDQAQQEDNLKYWNGKRWLLTGDIGFMDEDGFFEIRDRKKSLIKISGHSVFPKEVEQIIGQHSMVEEVAVAGIPDKLRGEAVVAWIVLKPKYKEGVDITRDQIKEWCIENMTRWKCPAYVELLDQLPVTPTGKVMKLSLQKEFETKLVDAN